MIDQFGSMSISGLRQQKFSDGNDTMHEPGGRTTVYVILNGKRLRLTIEPDRTVVREHVTCRQST